MKKILAILLCIIMIMSMSAVVFASETTVKENLINPDSMLVSEVQRKVDRAINEAKRQSGHITPVHESVLRDYYYDLFMHQTTESGVITDINKVVPVVPVYDLPNGGIATYIVYSTVEKEQVTTQFAVTMLDRQRTLDYILDHTTFSMGDVVDSILGYVPKVGTLYSIIYSLKSACDEKILKDINNANGYTKVTNFVSRTASGDVYTSTTTEGWHEHTRFYCPPNANNLNIEYFSQYVEK